MIEQVTVFLENSKGRLAALTRTVADAGVNMYALTISETSDYGLVRIICDDPAKMLDALEEADFRATKTKVAAIAIPNRPGGLADLLDVFDDSGLNIEYGYCFSTKDDVAIDVFKVHGAAESAKAAAAIAEAGFKLVTLEDLA